jgi:predicted nucleotidyltransferase
MTTTQLQPIDIDEAEWVSRLEEELARFVELVVREFDPHKIILFGSLAEGKPRLWSDIDIVVVRETDKNFIDRGLEIRHRFHPTIGIDILVYTPEEFDKLCSERLFFQEEILKKGKVLYERDG